MSFATDKRDEHLEHLGEIRSLMEQSSRFISLSGLSGVAAGVFALIGAAAAFMYLDIVPFQNSKAYYVHDPAMMKWGMNYRVFFLVDLALVLLFSISFAIVFTTRKARKKGQKIFDALTYRLMYSLLLPLCVGGLFCLALIYHGYHGIVGLIPPTMLIFYGLSLTNASKYTLHDLHYLGLGEIALGLIAIFYPGYGIEFWAIGFGVFHILYGTFMYVKYDV